ncbi:hypothetical protein B0T18DRAFT_233977 [Schizothecium vesticola]|uniref:Uncharacterized protein n=1 Tax=Schizothecium vesticola TaxID=314040 RepID=A0AA40EFC8_9PEZI|nr:hypothetical protein B0T18DRAFT_233977 [Schizothecium vesticola]
MTNLSPTPCLHRHPIPRPMASPSTSTIPSPPGRTITLLRILPDDFHSSPSPNQAAISTQSPGTKKYTFPLNPDPSGKLKGCPSYAVLSYTRPIPNPEPKHAQTQATPRPPYAFQMQSPKHCTTSEPREPPTRVSRGLSGWTVCARSSSPRRTWTQTRART